MDKEKKKQPLEEEVLRLRQRIAELETSQALSLSNGEATAQVFFEAASDGIVVVDAQGCIRLVNAKAEAMFGYSRNELLGQSIEMLLPQRFHHSHTQHRQNYLTSPHPRPMGIGLNLRGERKDGSEFPVEVSLSFVETDKDPLIMSFIADITQRGQMEEALRHKTAELQQHNEELDAFAHTVAHDLKNPLGRIIGFAELLELYFDELSDEELKDYLNMIAKNARKMVNIVDELLLLSIVRQSDEIKTHPLDTGHIVSEAQQRLSDLIQQYQAKIILPETWPTARGYGPWVEEVWVNYISNAIEHGGEPPRVELGATTQPDDTIRFWVRDNGPGLTPQEQSRLFIPFTRLDQTRPKGHGLGLSIVRRIVERLGGQVGVESDVGQGSTFYFTLPAAEYGEKA
jgi:PAS domain S-box-containing protein